MSDGGDDRPAGAGAGAGADAGGAGLGRGVRRCAGVATAADGEVGLVSRSPAFSVAVDSRWVSGEGSCTSFLTRLVG